MKKTISLIIAIAMTLTVCVTNVAGIVTVVHADQAYTVQRMVADEPDPDDPDIPDDPDPTEAPAPDPTEAPAPDPTEAPAPDPTEAPVTPPPVDPAEEQRRQQEQEAYERAAKEAEEAAKKAAEEAAAQEAAKKAAEAEAAAKKAAEDAQKAAEEKKKAEEDQNYSLMATVNGGTAISSIPFGSADVGMQRDVVPLTITNLGNNTVDLIYCKSGDADNAFSLSLGGGGGTQLAPNESTRFNVSMSDSLSVGKYNATLLFADKTRDPKYTKGLAISVSGTVTAPTPIADIDVVPSRITLATGGTCQFSAILSTNYTDDDFPIKWAVAGSRSTGTKISNDGLLTVASDESATTISVIASLVDNPTINDTATVALQRNSYNVNVYADPTNGGSVTGGGAVSEGGSVTLSAVPRQNFYFNGWVINGQTVSTATNYTITNVRSNMDVYAKFAQNTVRVTADTNNSDGGNVVGGGTFPYGGSTTLSAKAYDGYVFTGWKENDTFISRDASIKLNNLTVDRKITAIFDQTSHTLTLAAYPPEGGTVSGGGRFDLNTGTTIKATPNAGWRFEGWQVNNQYVCRNPEYKIDKISQDYTCTAVFIRNTGVACEISSGVATTGGSIAPSGKVNVLYGQNITYTITPKSGFAILAVAVDGVQVGPVSQYTFYNVQGPHAIAAAFVQTDAGKAAAEASGKATQTKKVEPVKKTTENTATSESVVNIDEAAKGEGGDNYVEEMDLTDIRIPTDEELGVTVATVDDTDSDVTKMLGKSMSEVDTMIASGDTMPILDAAFYTGHLGAYVVNSMEPAKMTSFDYNKLSREELMMASDDNINPSLPDLDVVVQKMLTTEDVTKLAKGEYVDISVSLTGEASDDVDPASAKIMKNAVGKKPVKFFDLTMLKTVDGNTQKVTELPTTMEVVIEIPDDVYESGKNYSVLRVHNGELAVLPDLDDDPKTITFRTDRFSTYAIAKEVATTNGLIAWLAGGAIVAFGVALTCLLILVSHQRKMRRAKRAAK